MPLHDPGAVGYAGLPAATLPTEPHPVPCPGERRDTRRIALRRTAWLALLPVCFVVFSASFNAFPVIERRHSVLGDADAANFAVLLRDFSLSRSYGNEYNSVDRSLGDNAQKHKIHHAPYALLGGAAHDVLSILYRRLGIPESQALYSVNAGVACVNMLLLFLLIGRFNPNGNPAFPFLVLYAGALSTWIFSSIPESWPFSATLVLGYFLLLGRRPVHPLVAGGALGLVMLNNIFLSALSVLVVAALARESGSGWLLARRTAAVGAVAVGTWLAGLSVLSLFDGSFRPDRFVRYTLWFREFTTGNFLPPSDPYVWKSAGTNLLVNSVVSNQPDPAVPQEALLTTVQTSLLGSVALIAYLCLVGAAGFALARGAMQATRRHGWSAALRDPALDLTLWCAVMLLVTAFVFYPSGFLYSTVVVPVIVVLLCRHLDLRVRWQKALLYAALVVILVNNTSQVLQFRDALRALS